MAAAGSKRKDVNSLLEKLHDFSPGSVQCHAGHAKEVVVDISEHLSVELSPVQYGEAAAAAYWGAAARGRPRHTCLP